MASTDRRNIIKTLLGATSIGAMAAADAQQGPGNADNKATGTLDEAQAHRRIAELRPAVVLLEVETALGKRWGSGFFVSSDGLLVTNRHVVVDGLKVTCIYKNKDRLPARMIKVDDQYDLALVKVDVKESVPNAKVGDSDAVPVGVLIAVTGYPRPSDMVHLGMALDSSTSRGSVNGLRYAGDAQAFLGDRALQIDAPVSPGNSGGPVMRLDTGEVIGVVASGFTSSGNLTFAVPINQAKVLIAGTGMAQVQQAAPPTGRIEGLEPGDLRTLNTISSTKELPSLFAHGFPFSASFRANQAPIDNWISATGVRPADVTPLLIADDELYFGATDGKLRRWNLRQMHETPTVLLHVGDDMVFVDPPAVTKDHIIAAAGSVELKHSIENRVTLASGLAMAFGVAGAGLTSVVRIRGAGLLVGLNRRNGNVDWTLDSGWVGSPTVFSDRVYYGGIGERGCVEALQGKSVWKSGVAKGSEAEYYQIGHVDETRVLTLVVPVEAKVGMGRYVLFGDKKARMEANDPATGKVLWSTEIGDIAKRTEPLGSAFFVDAKRGIAYAIAAQIVAAVNVVDGKVLWTYDHAKTILEEIKKSKDKTPTSAEFTPQLAIHDGIIYVGSRDKRLWAFNGEDGKRLWHYQARGVVGPPTYHDGSVLVGSSDGTLHVVDAKTGELVWRVQTRSEVASRPVVHRGLVLAPTRDGSIETIRMPLA